jgi:hypothetical protein
MAFVQRSRDIAARFLQTVVIVDDLARFRSTDTEPPGPATAAPSVRDRADVASATPDLVLTEPTAAQMRVAVDEDTDSDDLDAKSIVDGFAALGLVCAVIKPAPDESLKLSQTTGFRKADIVVLDWVLHKNYGDVAIEIIASLLEGDPARLRLIAIYTGHHDLQQIADRVAQGIDTFFPESVLTRPNPFTIRKGPVQVTVYAKPKAKIPAVLVDAVARITQWDALPERLVSDFAEMTSGLVAHIAVASLSALRSNTHRILRRLSQPLDAAYLWHRATQVDPLDAEGDLKAIVIEEIASVLDDEAVEEAAAIDAIDDWLTDNIPHADYRARFGLSADATQDDAVNLLTYGTSAKTGESEAAKGKFTTLAKNPHAKTASQQCFASTASENVAAQENFAALLSIKTHYSSPAPILTLGSVLRLNNEGQASYWVCVQPVCDSVRLQGATAFPLLPLSVDPAKFHIVLVQAGAPTLRLRLDAKPSQLRLQTFLPNASPAGTVRAEKSGDAWYFVDSDGSRYEWLAELKPQHALRVVDMLSHQLRRVGVNESEWLRLWSGEKGY